MTRLILGLATVIAMSACSRDRAAPAIDESANTARDLRIAEPDTAGLADSIALASRTTQPVSPTEQAARPEPAAAPAPKKTARAQRRPTPARPPVDTAAPAPDTATARGYAPVAADSSAHRDTAHVDTARSVTPDTATAAARGSAPTPPSSDTVVSRAPTADTSTSPTSDRTTSAGRTALPDSTPSPNEVNAASSDSSAESASRRTLPIGTQIHAALDDSINSRRDSAGRTITAQVTENVTGAGGQVLVPAGSTVQLTVTKLASSKSKNSPGQLVLRVDGIQLGGAWKKLQADIQPVSRELRGRGVTGGDAAKVGVGAAGGAVLGRVIGGNTKGAVIGGVVGAAGGAVVASQTATRDVIVKAKTPLVFTLTAQLVTP